MLVVEPDGTVTCIGTDEETRETAWISATNGSLYGHLAFDLVKDGPGPSLTFTVDDDSITEGAQISFRVVRRLTNEDVTARASGTRYTVFVGSGIPNDPQPSVITGSPDDLTAENFLIDDVRGTFSAPPSIGRANWRRAIVFVRNGNDVGWQSFRIEHALPAM